MAITAAVKGLESLTDEDIVLVCSDSRYPVNAFNKGSLKYWNKNRWLTDLTGTPVQNRDLWKYSLELTQKRVTRFKWITSCGGIRGNEEASRLSRQNLIYRGKARYEIKQPEPT